MEHVLGGVTFRLVVGVGFLGVGVIYDFFFHFGAWFLNGYELILFFGFCFHVVELEWERGLAERVLILLKPGWLLALFCVLE